MENAERWEQFFAELEKHKVPISVKEMALSIRVVHLEIRMDATRSDEKLQDAQEKIALLERRLAKLNALQLHEPSRTYIFAASGRRFGHFCPECFEFGNRISRLEAIENSVGVKCPICRSEFLNVPRS